MRFGRPLLIKSGEASDSEWTGKIKDAFIKWLDQNPNEVKITRALLDAFMENRTL